MGGNLIQQQDRRGAAAVGDEFGMGEDEAEEQRLLLTSRAARSGLAFGEMGDGEVLAEAAGRLSREGEPAGAGTPAPAGRADNEEESALKTLDGALRRSTDARRLALECASAVARAREASALVERELAAVRKRLLGQDVARLSEADFVMDPDPEGPIGPETQEQA